MKRNLFASAFSALLATLTSVAFAAAIDTSGLDLNALAVDRTGIEASATSNHTSGSYPASKLLDGGAADNQRYIAGGKESVVTFAFPQATVLNSYGIQAADYNGSGRAPKIWTFEGSTDGSTWELLDTQSSETNWSKKELRVYSCANKKAYTAYRFNFTQTNGDGTLSLAEVYFYNIALAHVAVTALPIEIGTVSPAYGTATYNAGDAVVASACETFDRDGDGAFTATCLGYDLYRAGSDGEWEFVSSDTTSSHDFGSIPEVDYKLVWKYDVQVKVTATAEHGSVNGAATYAYASPVTLTATPDEDYYFVRWTGLPEGVDSTQPSVSFSVTDAVSVEAVFATFIGRTRYVAETGDDEANTGLTADSPFAHVAKAVNSLGEDGGVIYLAKGTYAEAKSAAGGEKEAIRLDRPIQIIGQTGDPEDVLVKPTSTGGFRVFTLAHADAKLQYLSVANGKVNQGGNVKIEAAGGVIEDCIIRNGANSDYSGGGGNLYMNAGRVSRCVIRNGAGQSNNNGANGGGFWMNGGILENCLVTKNTGRFAGGVISGTAKVINCTIVDNTFNTAGFAAGVNVPAKEEDARKVAVVNTVISGNHNSGAAGMSDLVFTGHAAAFTNCASAEGLINETCVTGDLGFADAANGDWSLSVSSPLRDQGVDPKLCGAVSVTDLLGKDRVMGASADIGCYEFEASGLVGDFMIDCPSAIVPATVTLTASVEGGNGAVSYVWDMTDGVAAHACHYETTTPTFVWTCEHAGKYTITLTATSGAESCTAEHDQQTSPAVLYVAKDNAEAAYPYDSEATAASTIADAVEAAMDGATIYVAASETAYAEPQIDLEKDVKILGATGDPKDVSFTSTRGRAFSISAAKGLVANMSLAGSTSANTRQGGTVLIAGKGGTVSNCVITCTTVSGWGNAGTGVACSFGLVTHCVIQGGASFSTGDAWDNGGAVRLRDGAKFENSLVKDFSCSKVDRSGGFVVSAYRSSVINCSIINCRLPESGQEEGDPGYAISATGDSLVKNTVVYGVTLQDGTTTRVKSGAESCFVNCASDGETPMSASSKLITAAAFKDYVHGDYRPAVGGVLHDAGTTEGLVVPATDLAGRRRVTSNGKIDIGCYEGSATGIAIVLR